MRFFLGALAIAAGFLLMLQPNHSIEIQATVLLVGGLLVVIPEYEE